LRRVGDELKTMNGTTVAPVIGGIPRFVDPTENYAENFGFQWKRWRDTLSDARGPSSGKYDLLIERTRFDLYEKSGKTLLECGMGGGDDTESLLKMGFAEVHAFDLSTSVERAREVIDDPRLVLSQASIFDIPYSDQSFDFVFCHRVLQHTPDPVAALRCVCRKVKPGGVLFAHSYKLSFWHLGCFKYKIRWFTKHLPTRYVLAYVEKFGPAMRKINKFMHKFGIFGRAFAYNFVPLYYYAKHADFDEAHLLELDQLNTFDALTPRYDKPMTTRRFKAVLEEEGFVIEHFWESPITPLFGTARKRA
jgi:ubiquinone/menaquinone biosynthesis C-methylase UbiE